MQGIFSLSNFKFIKYLYPSLLCDSRWLKCFVKYNNTLTNSISYGGYLYITPQDILTFHILNYILLCVSKLHFFMKPDNLCVVWVCNHKLPVLLTTIELSFSFHSLPKNVRVPFAVSVEWPMKHSILDHIQNTVQLGPYTLKAVPCVSQKQSFLPPLSPNAIKHNKNRREVQKQFLLPYKDLVFQDKHGKSYHILENA